MADQLKGASQELGAYASFIVCEDAVNLGAEIVCGGRRLKDNNVYFEELFYHYPNPFSISGYTNEQ
jgi:hypothetical protein